MKKSGKSDLTGDSDPMDILVLTEKEITHGDILVFGRPIGGLRMIDGMEADDKIIAILDNDAVYGRYRNIFDLPTPIKIFPVIKEKGRSPMSMVLRRLTR